MGEEEPVRSGIRVCRAEDAEVVWRFDDHDDNVETLRFGPHGRWLASTDTSGRVCAWDLARGEKTLDHRYPRQASGVVFTPDGRALATSGSRGASDWWVDLWALKDQRSLSSLGPLPSRLRLAISLDGRWLAKPGVSRGACYAATDADK